MSNEIVTVYIITKNRLEKLKRALESVINQTYKELDIIIVNDNSTDGTKKYLENLNVHNVSVYHNDSNQGACYSRNVAIKSAIGYYITGLDDDDEFLADRVSTLKREFSDKYAFIFSDDNIISDNGSTITNRPKFVNRDSLLIKNVVGNQIFTLTERMRFIGGFDVSLPAAQDYDVWIRLINVYKTANKASIPLQNVYQDSGVRISNTSNKFKGYYQFFTKHKYLMNKNQVKSQIFNLYRCRRKSVSFRTLLVLVCRENYKGLIKDFLRTFHGHN